MTILALIATAIVAAKAYAAAYEFNHTYYSDASYRVVVGEAYINCQGKTTKSGITTAYRLTEREPCCGGWAC